MKKGKYTGLKVWVAKVEFKLRGGFRTTEFTVIGRDALSANRQVLMAFRRQAANRSSDCYEGKLPVVFDIRHTSTID